MRRSLLVLGAGVRARLARDLAAWHFGDRFEITGYFDDGFPAGSMSKEGLHVLGSIDEATSTAADTDATDDPPSPTYLLAMGSPAHLRACDVLDRLLAAGVPIASLTPGDAFVSPSAELGRNTVLMPGTFVGHAATLGDLAFLHGGAVIEHDVAIGRNVMIGPGATIAGSVVVGDHTFIGAGVTIADGIEIGEGCVVGVGAVVVRSIPAHSVAFGSPARVVRAVSEGMYAPTAQEIATWKATRT